MDKAKVVMDHIAAKDPDAIKKENARKAKEAKQKIDKFREFLKISHEDKYKYYSPFGPTAIVRLYLFIPERESNHVIYTSLTDDGRGIDKLTAQVMPLAKVLRIGSQRAEGYDELEEGMICTIQEDILGAELNPQWVQWQKDIREQPSLERDMQAPQQFIPKLGVWKKYVFTQDKFREPKLETDGYTFLIPQVFLKTEFNHKLYLTDNK